MSKRIKELNYYKGIITSVFLNNDNSTIVNFKGDKIKGSYEVKGNILYKHCNNITRTSPEKIELKYYSTLSYINSLIGDDLPF